MFRNGREVALRGFAPNLVAIDRLLPLSHFGGFQTFYPDFASGKGGAPFKTVADYENNLRRNAGYAAVYDRAIARFREGMAKGVTQPKLVVRNMIGQFDNLIAEGVEIDLLRAGDDVPRVDPGGRPHAPDRGLCQAGARGDQSRACPDA
ncbi:DUF885 family protein [Sphingomonas aerolata]|uniref:DUF885 family protein n=1 Tax=Sphingomonas aerolata TaxID=185951 RepID=UPI002FE30236